MRQDRILSSLGMVLAVCFVASAPVWAITIGTPYKVIDKATGSSHGLHSSSMIYADGVYAIAYVDTDAVQQAVKVAFVDANNPGLPLGIYRVDVDDVGSYMHGVPRIAYDSSHGKFGVVWVRYLPPDGSTCQVEYRWLTKTGAMSASLVNLTSGYGGRADYPTLCYDAEYNRFAMVFSWYQAGVSNWDLRLITFDYTGAPGLAMAASIPTQPPDAQWLPNFFEPMFGGPEATGPSIVSGPSGLALGYLYDNNNRYVRYVYIRKSDLAIVAGPVQVSASGLCFPPQLTYNATHDEFGAVWAYWNLSNNGSVWFARLGSSGLIERKMIATAFSAHSPDLWWDGGRYITGWYEAPSKGVWNLKAATCTRTGVLESAPVIVQAGGGEQLQVAARGADNYFIQWRIGYEDIWGASATNANVLIATANPPEGGTVAKNPDKPVYDQGEQVWVTATPAGAQWIFTGWSGDASGTDNPVSVTMDRAKSVTANFYNTAWPSAHVVIDPAGSGTATINGKSVLDLQAAAGTQMTMVATANAGFLFRGWYAGTTLVSTNRAYTFTMPTVDVTYRAFFSPAYSVTVAANPINGGTTNPGGTSLWYVAGAQVEFSAVPAAGFSFVGWTVNGASAGNANPTTITIDSNKVVYANFQYGGGGTTYALTTYASPSTAGSVAPEGTSTYPEGSIVQLTATANPGYVFDHWNGDVTGTLNPTTVTMNGPVTATAVFREGSAEDTPAIANLKQLSSIRSGRADFQIDFEDGDGNLTGGYVVIAYRYKSNLKENMRALAIPRSIKSISGESSGTIQFTAKFKGYKTSYKSFEFKVYLEDAQKNTSNVLVTTAKKSVRGK